MPTHMRTVIRHGVRDALLAASTNAGARVQCSPSIPRKVFPAICIEDAGAYLSDGVAETQEAITMPAGADRTIKRLYRFAVVMELQPSPNDDDARDALDLQVHGCIGALSIAGVKSIKPVAYVSRDDDSTGKTIRQGIQIFEAMYFTSQADPSTPR